jgi:hypothetical protein
MRVTVLAGWFLAGLLAASPAFSGETAAPLQTGFDRIALDMELSLPLGELRRQGADALRAHVEVLAQHYAALERAPGISSDVRRLLSDRILARVAEVGLAAREGDGAAAADARSKDRATGATRVVAWEGAVGLVGDHSFLVIGLLGGLVIAYALGSLAGYRRGASQASYYGAGDPRLWFVTAAEERKKPVEYPARVTLEHIRATLASGRTVLLQLGYDVSPRRRKEFLRLIREMQQVLNEVEGQVHSVWEDPKHPNRFYEVVVCDSLESLDRLTGDRDELASLAARIEACWLPGRPVVRRTWWGVLAGRVQRPEREAAALASGRAREDLVS